MKEREKPAQGGPSPAGKAEAALGEKLNRKPKEPPSFPGRKLPNNPPPARRRGQDVDENG